METDLLRSIVPPILAGIICVGCGGNSSHSGAGGSSGNANLGGTAGALMTGGSSSGGSGGSSGDARLMPFEDGRAWTFEISAVTGSVPGDCPDNTGSVTGKMAAPDGSAGWYYHPACVGGDYVMVQDRDNVTAYPSGSEPGIEYMKMPVEDGATWANYVWRDAGPMSVPAGTFESCWRREIVGSSDEYTVFCRAVGLVQSHSLLTNLHTELESRNF
jgi:hypothetical protein